MSMPNIPDIMPELDITFQDSINLLLTSIAMEEISLSKLMDAETNKILFVLNECKNNEACAQDTVNVNNSINKTIINMIKMQMLLQFKLENVEKLIPTTSTNTTTSTSTTTTSTCSHSTTTDTTTSTTSTCSTTTKCPKCGFYLMSKSKGVVSNQSDNFYGQDVTLKTFISSCNCKDNIIRYHVGNDYNSLHMTASAYDIKIECPSSMQPHEIKIWGKGQLTRTLRYEKISMNVNFELLVWRNKVDKNGFQMIIREVPVVAHNSGFVKICCYNGGLEITTY